MEAERRQELSRWAQALERAEGEDLRAAGRAIAALCDTPETLGASERAELQRWAKALGRSDVAELRAAGRAIRALCAESIPREDEPEEREEPAPQVRERRVVRPRKPIVLPWRALGIALAVLVLLGGAAVVAARAAAPELGATGPPANAVVGRAALDRLAFSAGDAHASWTLDGRPVTPKRAGGRFVLKPRKLADGEHVVVVSRRGPMFSSATRRFAFVVDTAAPKLRLDRPATVRHGEPLVVRGRLEPGARLVRAGSAVALDDRGRFVLRALPAPRSLAVVATDAAGNSSRWRIPVTIAPRRPAQPVRSVHVTAYGWADKTLREGVLALIRAKKINAVELDLKDEAGEIGWNPQIPLARRMHAALAIYDLGKTVRQLHAQGVRVIGRLVCFRDPIHAAAAWKAGRRDEVVQTPDGGPYAGYGGFTNFASPAVRRYNIDVAVAAAKLGVDEILYDYVRRPDGPTGSMVFPGLKGTPEQGIARFLAESKAALAGTKALVGASVFGVAATRPKEVAQDIPAMARHLDYVAPMLYPSHWGPGEYDVADPNGSPYEIVRRSTVDFVRQVRGTGARVVPWLQDFSLGRDYGPAEVRAQIRGARDAGADEFLLWDPAVSYTSDALDGTAATPALGLTTEPLKNAPWPVRLPDPKPAPKPVAKPEAVASTQPKPGLEPNELGQIPIVMHHMVRPDRVGDYDQTPAEFRAELELLWKRGYVPVGIGDIVSGRLDVPKGMTPVGFTFDDSTIYQLALRADGTVKPDTAVGIMLAFARTHPGFVPAGTFYLNREPFGGVAESAELVRWLVKNGFELGNHTHDHLPLRDMSDAEVQRQIATGEEVIHQALPDYEVESMSLPLGAMPRTARLAVQGTWKGKRYGPYGVLLVGANPSPSPFSRSFDRGAIARIRTSHAGWNGERDFAFSFWMRELEQNPGARFVSDGDPKVVSVRAGSEADLRPALRSRMRVVQG